MHNGQTHVLSLIRSVVAISWRVQNAEVLLTQRRFEGAIFAFTCDMLAFMISTSGIRIALERIVISSRVSHSEWSNLLE